MQRISTHCPPRGLLQELTSQKVPKSIKSKLTINIFCINGQSAIWIPYGDPGLHTWRPIRRSRHLCSPAPVAGIDNQYVFCGALIKASHIAPSGVPPVLAQLCSLNSFFICSISGNSRATALQVLSLAQLWRNSGAALQSQFIFNLLNLRQILCNCTSSFIFSSTVAISALVKQMLFSFSHVQLHSYFYLCATALSNLSTFFYGRMLFSFCANALFNLFLHVIT